MCQVFLSPLQKGVKTPGFWFLNHIPALKDGASDLSYVPYNSVSCPDIYVGVKNSKINGIYADLTLLEWTHFFLDVISVRVIN